MTARPRVSVVIPARHEEDQIGRVLDRILDAVRLPCEVIVVVDEPGDPTRAEVARRASAESRLRCLVSGYPAGPANAIRYGIAAAAAPVAVVTMADGCDDPRQIDDLARLVERGVAMAAASRYCPGGQQVGGPLIKGLLSRAAGRSLRVLARVGTHDATNSFKAYSTAFVAEAGIDTRHGFAIGIELTAKARRLRRPVAELPTIWLDRPSGVSSFRLTAWIPHYLRWYLFAFGPRLTPERLRERRGEGRPAPARARAADLAAGEHR